MSTFLRKTLTHALLANVVVLAASLQARADFKQAGRVEITAFGEFGPAPGRSVDAPGTGAGKVTEVVTNRLLRKTDCILARLGTRMGILVRASSREQGYLPVHIEVRHPPITGPNQITLTRESWQMKLSDKPLYTGWYFGERYELVPGKYTIAVLIDSEPVAEKDFNVVLSRSHCQ